MKLLERKKKQKHVAVVETAHHKLCEMQKTRSVKKELKYSVRVVQNVWNWKEQPEQHYLNFS